MMNTSELEAVMGNAARELPSLDGLDQADIDRLARLVKQAHDRQRARITQASEEALKHVPALVRGAVRKLLMS